MTAAGPCNLHSLIPHCLIRAWLSSRGRWPAGIGRVTARALAESGWHVARVDLNADGSLRLPRAVLRSAKRGRD